MQKLARRQLFRIASRSPQHRNALRGSVRLDGSLDLGRLIRLAYANPHLRSTLLPILREAANQPGRRKGKAEASFLVWTMDAKDPSGGALLQKRPGIRTNRKSIPAKWFMPVKDLKKTLEKVTDRKKRRALNVANKAGLAAVRKLYKAWFEKNWVTPWVKGEDEGYDYEPSAEDEDEFRLKAVNRVLGGIGSLKPSHKPTSRDLKRVKRLKAWLETGSQRREDEADQAEWEADQRDGADDLRKKRREDYRKTDRYKGRTKDTEWEIKEDAPIQPFNEEKSLNNIKSVLANTASMSAPLEVYPSPLATSHWSDTAEKLVHSEGNFAITYRKPMTSRGGGHDGEPAYEVYHPAVYQLRYGFYIIADIEPGKKWRSIGKQLISVARELSEAEPLQVIEHSHKRGGFIYEQKTYGDLILSETIQTDMHGNEVGRTSGVNSPDGFQELAPEEARAVFFKLVKERTLEGSD